MALTLDDIITAARDRHPAYHKTRVPDAVLARFLTRYQRRLISKAADIDPSLVAQQASIVLAADAENAVGVVGAGTSGGLPGDLTAVAPPAPIAVERSAGAAIEIDVDSGTALFGPAVVTSATATTLTRVGSAWVVNAYAGKYVVITDGTGAHQRREITSNTADTLTLKAGQTWQPVPNATSIFKIVTPALTQTDQMGVITEFLPTGLRQGYLVRLDAVGTPYLDLGKPLVAHFDQGIDLPPIERLVGGTVRGGTGPVADLHILPYRRRSGWELYSVWVENGKLFLAGVRADWLDVASIDVRYVPIAPAFTKLTDYFLVPDSAYDALVARSAEACGRRVKVLPDAPAVDTDELTAEADEAEVVFLNGVGGTVRGHVTYVKDVR